MTDTIDDEAAALQHLKVAFEHLGQARARLTQGRCKKSIADHLSELGGQYFVQHFSALAAEAVKSIKAEDTQKNLARVAYLRANGITHSSRQIPAAEFFVNNIEADSLVDPLLVAAQGKRPV